MHYTVTVKLPDGEMTVISDVTSIEWTDKYAIFEYKGIKFEYGIAGLESVKIEVKNV